MTDLVLVFPPQWSPFQPALSLPSLSAWLKRAGHSVRSLDLNILFYEWLLSDEYARVLLQQVEESGWSEDVKAAYSATFSNVAAFRKDIGRLQLDSQTTEDPTDCVRRHFLAIKSVETYLDAVSNVSSEFIVSPYEFRLRSGSLETAALDTHVACPPPGFEPFLSAFVRDQILMAEPRIVGLSCIGQEQLYFSLLVGRLIRELSDVPVIVGGTILSRMFERGVVPPGWFDAYFDVIVRNEGEKPTESMLGNLRAGRRLCESVPGVVHAADGSVTCADPCPPLGPAELPIPDFDDLPLGSYFSSEITLPLLSSRGCYWGKCEFCHHGMVYGEKYAAYGPDAVLDTVQTLAARYGAKHFAFNDEAIPPRMVRRIGSMFPPHAESGWTFTGLIKFEPSFSRQDFGQLSEVGFRSLYVGLESASERVLGLMRKRSTRETIVNNLTFATEAGIWMHCFLFFGFPGETDVDAQETFDFIVDNSTIVSSFGAGTFSLEHNAPIFHHYDDFGVSLKSTSLGDVDVYYDYDVERGIGADRALEWQQKLTRATVGIPNYVAAKWVPRELLLCLLSAMSPRELLQVGAAMLDCGGFPVTSRLSEFLTRVELSSQPGTCLIVNRANGRAITLRGPAALLLQLCQQHDRTIAELRRDANPLFNCIAFKTDELATSEAGAG